jgi:hypothetical protein
MLPRILDTLEAGLPIPDTDETVRLSKAEKKQTGYERLRL